MQPSSLYEGIQPLYAGTILAAWLQASPRPFTGIIQAISGSPVRLQVLRAGQREMVRDEPFRLGAPPGLCRWRHGLLWSGDLLAASVTLMWLPERLDPAVAAELEAGQRPAGAVLAASGMYRTDRRAAATSQIEEVTGQPAACISSAVMTIGGLPVGIAEEFITLAFAEALVAGPAWG
jgi:hypothetical protein